MRKISISLSGNENSSSNSTKQQIQFCYFKGWDGITASSFPLQQQSYDTVMEDPESVAFNYDAATFNNITLGVRDGVTWIVNSGTTTYSFYRREVLDTDPVTYSEFEPVKVISSSLFFTDYNISNGRKYQYVVYPITGTTQHTEIWANLDENGKPGILTTDWGYWTIAGLVPATISVNLPIIKHAYEVDYNNVWALKYGIEAGDQTQNISKTENKNLSQYPKFAIGEQNNLSGSMSCLLGSEIAPYTQGYTEKLPFSRPISSNEKVDMLNAWRKLVASKNPVLIRDAKGQSFIAHITSGSNKLLNNSSKYPDQISFNWTQIGSVGDTVITGSTPSGG